MKITTIEMRGLLTGKCVPRDMRVNEDLAQYFVRKFEDHAAEVARLNGNLDASKRDCQEFAKLAGQNAARAQIAEAEVATKDTEIGALNSIIASRDFDIKQLNEQLLHLRANRDEWERKATSNFEECAKMDAQVRALAAEGSKIKEAFKALANTAEEADLYGDVKYMVEPSEYDALSDAVEGK